MSNIPKSRRKKSKLETLHIAYRVRKRIVNVLAADFGYKDENMVAAFTKFASKKKESHEQLEEEITKARNFYPCFIEDERKEITHLCQGICRHLRMANTIFPRYTSEWIERRLQMDKAMEYCNALQDELQFITETLPCDKNKYTPFVLEIDELYNKIRALRQADNRFLKEMEDFQSVGNLYNSPVVSAANFANVNNNGNANYNNASNSIGVRPDSISAKNSLENSRASAEGKVVQSAKTDK